MRIRKYAAAGALLAAFAGGMLTTVDVFPALGTYGVSVGTNMNYCSIELVHGVPAVSCEHVH
jgi:hypothetical protein